MAGSRHSPPRCPRRDATDPDDALLDSPTNRTDRPDRPGFSPAARRDSPESDGASARSPSPTSTTFLSLPGATAVTPLSSLDGEEAQRPASAASSVATDDSDKMEKEGLLAGGGPSRSSRSQKGEAPSAPASVPSAPRPSAMAQSPKRNRGHRLSPQNTRSKKSITPSDPTPSTTSISASGLTPFVPLVRPSFTNGQAPSPLPEPPEPPEPPAIVRTTSSHGDLPLRHPVPDLNARSGALVGNVAQLEASAEQLSKTDSIEDAIREAHQELKRSDSRRSSILAASVRRANSTRATSDTTDPAPAPPDCATTPATTLSRRPSRPQLLRVYSGHDSIIELNSAARSGGFSPHDYIMSPTSSIAGSMLQRSTSKASSNGSANGSVHGSINGLGSGLNILGITDQSLGGDDHPLPYLSRHGTGKSSMRSVRSGKLSLPEIAELEPPTTLTQDALDEADRMLAAGSHHDEDKLNLCAAAYQETSLPSHPMDVFANPAMSIPSSPPPTYFSPNLQQATADVENPMGHAAYYPPEQPDSGDTVSHYDVPSQDRPATSGSGGTFEQAQRAFHDFDGVHCDPEEADQVPELPRSNQPGVSFEAQPSPPLIKRPTPQRPPARPTSYLDPTTGRQMLYYPARVPAMLQLPTKLSKGSKFAERNQRRSQVVSMLAQEPARERERQSRVWLPDPTTGSDLGSPLFNRGDPLAPSSSHSASLHELAGEAAYAETDVISGALGGPTGVDISGEGFVRDDGVKRANPVVTLRRPSRILDADKRKARMSTALDKIPPQLRASAYFDLPAATGPEIEAKNGSAMDTLDDILNAAAHAPVSAFTDHAFAGHLGAEVYGAEKKRNKKTNSLNLEKLTAATAADENNRSQRPLRASRSRSSFFGLVSNIRKVSDSVDGRDDTRSEEGRAMSSNGRLQRRRSHTLGRDGSLTPGLSDGGGGGGLLSPGEDERLSDEEEDYRRVGDYKEEDDDEDDAEDEEDLPAGHLGAPTTLLAELQMRKEQQKLRTRPITTAFPNGMHSTLLELDAVAEVERKTRRVKKVNLAWEDPTADGDGEDDGLENDEDVPLGLLYAAKAAGHNDVSAAATDLTRPLGLMEKKELEDNEPLSRRRERLQGRDPGAVSMYLSNGGNLAMKRQSVLTLTPMLSPGAANEQNSLQRAEGGDADVDEAEDEPLATRMNRLKARRQSELPLARPVSSTFSAELLGQFGDNDEDKDKKDAAKQGKIAGAAYRLPEEEETLGQRRQRLQAEKEARGQEMMGAGGGSGLAMNGDALQALTGSNRLSRRLSMADLLSAAPAGPAKGGLASGVRRSSQMSNSRTMTMSNADMSRGVIGQWGPMGPMGSASAVHLPSMGPMGGHMGMNMGMHNGMMGGAASYGAGLNGMGGMAGMNNSNPYRNTMTNGFVPGYNGGFGGYGGMPMSMPMQMPMGMPMQAPMQMPMAMPMQMGSIVPPQGRIDRVERWRQGVYP